MEVLEFALLEQPYVIAVGVRPTAFFLGLTIAAAPIV